MNKLQNQFVACSSSFTTLPDSIVTPRFLLDIHLAPRAAPFSPSAATLICGAGAVFRHTSACRFVPRLASNEPSCVEQQFDDIRVVVLLLIILSATETAFCVVERNPVCVDHFETFCNT